MAVLSGVTCLMAHFHLCYSSGAEMALLLCKAQPCSKLHTHGCACP